MTLHIRTSCLALLVAATALPSMPALADFPMVSTSTATDRCQTALPVFDGNVRKRPLAVQNEGSGVAFVTCSQSAGNTYVESGELYLASNDGQSHTVTCTAVLGRNAEGPRYIPKTVVVAANGTSTMLALVPADVSLVTNLGTPYLSYSCALPPGVGITDLSTRWSQLVPG